MTIENFWDREDLEVVFLQPRDEWRLDEVPVKVKRISEGGERVTVEPVDGAAPPRDVSPLELRILQSDANGRLKDRMSWLLACERSGGLSRAEGEQLFARVAGPSCSVMDGDETDLGR